MSDIGRPVGILIHTGADGFAAMRAFYLKALALPVRTDRPGFVSFEWGDMRLTIAVHSGVAGSAVDADRILVNFSTTDIDVAVARLADAGVPVVRPPEPESWGGRVATFRDPDGNLLQLLEFPQGDA